MDSDSTYAAIDVRERGEFNKRQIFRTTCVPRRDLESLMSRLVPVKSTAIVVCDEDDGRASLAAHTLEQMGYTDISMLQGGLGAWAKAGYELGEGTNAPSKDFGEKILVQKRVPEMTIQEYQHRVSLGEEFILIDTRTPEEFERATLPGSRNIPNGELVLRIAEVIGDSDSTVVVHCGGRTRSIIGTQILLEMNLPNTLIGLQNGTMGWLLAGYELETGRQPQPLPLPSSNRAAFAETFARKLTDEHRITHLSAAELRDLVDKWEHETLYLVDVRTAEEYEQGHISNFTWFPGGQALQRTDEIMAVRTGKIVLACDGIVRSAVVARWIKEMDFPNIYVLDGGVKAWEAAGQTLEQGWPRMVPRGLIEARETVSLMSLSTLKSRLETPGAPLVVDLETSSDFTQGHISGAVWIPRGWLELRIKDSASIGDTPIVLTCRTGEVSMLAWAGLRDMGYTNVEVLEGGKLGWSAAGFVLETGTRSIPVEPNDVVIHPLGDKGRMEYYLTWEEALGRKYESDS